MEDPISPSKDNVYVDAFLVNNPPPPRIRPDCVTCSEEFDSVCLTCLNCYDCCIAREQNKCAFCGGNVQCKDLCNSCNMCCQPCCDCFDDMNYDEDGIPLRRATPVKRTRRAPKRSASGRRRRGKNDDDDDEEYDPRKDPNIKRRIRQVPWTPEPDEAGAQLKRKTPVRDDPAPPVDSPKKVRSVSGSETLPRPPRTYGPHAWFVSSQPRFIQRPNPAYEGPTVGISAHNPSTGASSVPEHIYTNSRDDTMK